MSLVDLEGEALEALKGLTFPNAMLEPPGESTHSPEDGVCVVHDTKLALIKIPMDEQGISVTLPQSSDLRLRFPGLLVSLEDISYKYSPICPVVLQDISRSIHIGDRIGIVGLNGGGKSTLIKIVTDTASDAGDRDS